MGSPWGKLCRGHLGRPASSYSWVKPLRDLGVSHAGRGTIVRVSVDQEDSWGQAMELVWAWGLEHTGMALASSPEHLHPAPALVIKVERKGKKWHSSVPLTTERVLNFSSHLADALELVSGFISHIV